MRVDYQRLREAVESAPDYADAKAEQDRLHTLKEQADQAVAAASSRVSDIWDREADRLFGPTQRG